MHCCLLRIALCLLAVISLAAPADAGKVSGAGKLPKIMTGLDDGVSLEVLKCVRSHVEGFGHNQVVVVQFRLKKEGPIDKSKRQTKNMLYAANIKARDPAMANSFKCWGKKNGETTHSDMIFTMNWPVGQTGDGFVWLNIPERVQTVDLIF